MNDELPAPAPAPRLATDEGQLVVRVPTVDPNYRPVHEEVRSMIANVLHGALAARQLRQVTTLSPSPSPRSAHSLSTQFPACPG